MHQCNYLNYLATKKCALPHGCACLFLNQIRLNQIKSNKKNSIIKDPLYYHKKNKSQFPIPATLIFTKYWHWVDIGEHEISTSKFQSSNAI